MKQVLFLIVSSSLLFFSCKKTNSVEPVPTSLAGKWRMVAVEENSSGITTIKAPSLKGDVDITFTSSNNPNGFLFGNTPTNDISQSAYSIGANQSISIPVLAMTKAMETSWGSEFVDNVRSAQEYSFEVGGKLNIKTATKTLTFRKF